MSIPAPFILLQRVSRLPVVSELTRKGPLSGNLQGNQCTFSFRPYLKMSVKGRIKVSKPFEDHILKLTLVTAPATGLAANQPSS